MRFVHFVCCFLMLSFGLASLPMSAATVPYTRGGKYPPAVDANPTIMQRIDRGLSQGLLNYAEAEELRHAYYDARNLDRSETRQYGYGRSNHLDQLQSIVINMLNGRNHGLPY